jgi:hypothetical protein
MPRKKKVQVSDPLSAFIEKQFQSMLRCASELRENRKAYRRDLERKEQREFMRIKRKHGDIERENPNPFSSVLKEMSTREIAVKGRAKLDLNNFVYMCDYFLLNENKKGLEDGSLQGLHSEDIHVWISEFLHSKRYAKRNGKPCTGNDIKRIIYRFEHSPECKELHHWWSIFDAQYKEFCNPRVRDQSKNMTDKELFDQICKWNEEAKSEIEKEQKS